MDSLCQDILDAWDGDNSALESLKDDIDIANRTHLGGLKKYLDGLVKIGEMILERKPPVNESSTNSIDEIYQYLKSEYDGKLFSDNFLKTHITLTDGQIICWFDIDENDEDYEDKCNSATLFYDEVVKFLVDRFGEEFKYDDPRLSDDYIYRSNRHGQFEIVLDDDKNPPVIAIWENEENEMKTRFNENKFGRLVKEGWKRYPAANGCTIHDCGDCFVVTNKNGTTIGQCKTMTEAETIAEQANNDRRMFNEGAGAGYTVTIKDLKLGKVLDKKLVKGKSSYDDYYECKVEVLPCECEIGAESYYDDFFWEIHEYTDEEPTANIDGGVATIEYLPDSYTNADDAENDPEKKDIFEREIDRNLENLELDISFMYGAGWIHSNLPREKMELTDVDVDNKYMDIAITKLELNAPDLADAVNAGYQSTFDRE